MSTFWNIGSFKQSWKSILFKETLASLGSAETVKKALENL